MIFYNFIIPIINWISFVFLRNHNKLDITIETDFPKFAVFWKGYLKTLKAKGNGDTTHNPEIPKVN